MQTLKAVLTWCVCPVLTVVMTMQELSMLQWSCFDISMKPIHFGGLNIWKWFKCICHGRLQPDCIKTAQNNQKCPFYHKRHPVQIGAYKPEGIQGLWHCVDVSCTPPSMLPSGCVFGAINCGHPVVTRCKTKINQCSFQMALSCITESRGSYTVLLP